MKENNGFVDVAVLKHSLKILARHRCDQSIIM